MNTNARLTTALISVAVLMLPQTTRAFNSGSTGADGAFNPFLTNTELQLPPDGIFNFTSVNIPVGVTVTFKRNAANTPAVLLVQGNVVIDGAIDVSGKPAAPTGPNATDGGDPTDDGLPGSGGVGGFGGGHAALVGSSASPGNGLGPGGGGRSQGAFLGPSGASHATLGGGESAGAIYGSPMLAPLVGGSGGGGMASFWWTYYARQVYGMGGGGGGGAILIAASGSIQINGSISADGGGSHGTQGEVWTGGGGSGGAIRIVATHVFGRGRVSSVGGGMCCGGTVAGYGGEGGAGRIRVEADSLTAGLSSNPSFSQGLPNNVFVPGLPRLSITRVGAMAVPSNPTGAGDVTLPPNASDPVDVALHTNGVPPGTVIKLSVTPEYGAAMSTNSPPTTGTLADASTTVSVSVPEGRSVLLATTSFIVTAALGEQLAPYAQGETVEQVRLIAEAGQPSRMVLLTASGRELDLPAGALVQGW